MPYKLVSYDIEELKKIFSEYSCASIETIENKLHTVYFKDYFEHLGARTIIIEKEYTDHDYLEDFAGYYVSCFKKYKRKCVRLHFFNLDIKKGDFDAFLNGDSSSLKKDDLDHSYLGFIIVKPLPQTIIGRTCLKTYEPDNNRRCYPVIREYEANLFGIELSVNSLAYQEQDNVVAACATSALWSVFHGSGRLFQHPILSPFDITKIACSNLPFESRFFPNPGLTAHHMAQAIRSVNLEPYQINAKDQTVLRQAVYAYLKCGIPMIMGVSMVDTSDAKQKNGHSEHIGQHAVAITGFSLSNKNPHSDPKTGFISKSSRIDKLYAHDDQVGPFSRMILDYDKVTLNINNQQQTTTTIYTSWAGKNGRIGSTRAIPVILLIPLYHKIRIPFHIIYKIIIHFDDIIEKFRIKELFKFPERFEWDIHLTTINKIKTGFLSSERWRNDLRLQALLTSMPRF